MYLVLELVFTYFANLTAAFVVFLQQFKLCLVIHAFIENSSLHSADFWCSERHFLFFSRRCCWKKTPLNCLRFFLSLKNVPKISACTLYNVHACIRIGTFLKKRKLIGTPQKLIFFSLWLDFHTSFFISSVYNSFLFSFLAPAMLGSNPGRLCLFQDLSDENISPRIYIHTSS